MSKYQQTDVVLPIIAELETETHRLMLRSDGIIATGIDPELLGESMPEYVREAALQPGCTLIGRSEFEALRQLFDKADEMEAS